MKKSNLQLEFDNDFSTKVLPSKTNVMQENSVRQKKKRQNSCMLRVLGCFLGIKWAVAVPIFTLFNFFRLQTYFYAKSHLLRMLKSKKSDRWRKKCDRSTPALKNAHRNHSPESFAWCAEWNTRKSEGSSLSLTCLLPDVCEPKKLKLSDTNLKNRMLSKEQIAEAVRESWQKLSYSVFLNIHKWSRNSWPEKKTKY